jgi:hypothetical protein
MLHGIYRLVPATIEELQRASINLFFALFVALLVALLATCSAAAL